jgi:hypothetical protein
LTASPGERGSKKHLWLKRSAPRPKYVDAFTHRNDLPWNLQNSILLLVRRKAPTGVFLRNGEESAISVHRLAEVAARLTAWVKTERFAAGYSLYCQPLHRGDGYAYTKGVALPPQA